MSIMVALLASAAMLPPTAGSSQELAGVQAYDGQADVRLSAFDDAAGQSGTSPGLGEIVVTARRREESLQDVPVSVTAITADALESSGAADVRRLTVAVPGLTGSRNFSVFQPALRGIGYTGGSPGDESNTAVYVDGVYQPNPAANIIDFVQVDRVEVLRGPQGTLFGRNATGGLINVITPDPKFSFNLVTAADYARFDDTGEFKLRGYVTGPITNTLAADFAVSYRRSGNYIEDIGRNDKVGRANSLILRAKLLWRPFDGASVVLTGTRVRAFEGEANAVRPLNGNSVANYVPGTPLPLRPFQVALSTVPGVDLNVDNLTLRTSFDLGGVSLETSHFHQWDDFINATDTDGSALRGALAISGYITRAYSNDVRLASVGDSRFSWTVGAYQFNLRAGLQGDPTVISGSPSVPQLPAPRVVPYTTLGTTLLRPVIRTAAYAVYGEGSFDLTDQLAVTLGARYSSEQRKFQQVFNGRALFGLQRNTQSRPTYRASMLYEIHDTTNVYATFSTGFKSGVYNGTGVSSFPTRPEKVNAYEIGLKSQPANWLRLNASTFYYDYTDLQILARDVQLNTQALLNAASARIYGGELELDAQPSQALNLRVAVALLSATFNDFPNAQVFTPFFAPGARFAQGNSVSTQDVSGNDLLKAPRYTVQLGGTWKKPLEKGTFQISGNVFHSGRYFYDYANRVGQPAYTLVSGEVSWTFPDGKTRLRVFGINLANELITQQITPNNFTDTVTFERPRTLGVGLEFRY